MIKRSFDIIVSLTGLLFLLPIIILLMIIIWMQDFHSPFYMAPRVGKGGKIFKMIKFRSMVMNADLSGVDSTSRNDPRITLIGHFIRSYKLDELPQLFNVLIGDMSFVGPRPNVKRDIDIYTNVEKILLDLRPGITDFASIVFSDEGVILQNSSNPDIDYNQLIRPWKSRLGLVYVANKSLSLDIRLIILTIGAIFYTERALKGVCNILVQFGVDQLLIEVSKRNHKLSPYPPPGSNEIVLSR